MHVAKIISVKNNTDAIILHTAICAAGVTKQLLSQAKSDIWLAITPAFENACKMVIKMPNIKTQVSYFDLSNRSYFCLICTFFLVLYFIFNIICGIICIEIRTLVTPKHLNVYLYIYNINFIADDVKMM